MAEIENNCWTIRGNMAIHQSGARLVFEGHPAADTFQMTPEQFPKTLSAPDTARLFREGVEAYRRSYFDRSRYEPVSDADASPKAAEEARAVTVTVKRRHRVSLPASVQRGG